MSRASPGIPAPAPKTIFYALDGIRGIAALLVVVRHTERFFVPWQVQESYLAVDVFFVLSGVVIAQAYGARLADGRMSFAAFARTRFVRIMPLYLLGTAISIVAALAGIFHFGSPALLAWFVLLGLFMLPNPGIGTIDVYPLNNPAWSLPLELVVNGCYAGCIRHLSRARMLVLMAASAAGIALTIHTAKSHSLNIGFWARSFPFGFFRVGYSFFAGVLLFQAYPFLKRASGRFRAGTLGAWVVLLLTAAALAAAPSAPVQPFYDFFAVICIFPLLTGCGMLAQPTGVSARVFRFLGLISYAVYTLHAPLGGVMDGLSNGGAIAHAPLSGLAFLAVLVPLCVVADRYYDYPVRRRLLRLGRTG